MKGTISLAGLDTDMKAVTMTSADSKEVTPRGGSSKVRLYIAILAFLFISAAHINSPPLLFDSRLPRNRHGPRRMITSED
jgi:hypothetical protein